MKIHHVHEFGAKTAGRELMDLGFTAVDDISGQLASGSCALLRLATPASKIPSLRQDGDPERPSLKPVNITDGRTDLQGVGVFARAAIADRDTNPVEWVVSGGIAGKGVIPGRDHDTFGIGYAYGEIQDIPFVTSAVLENASARVEAYYSVAISPAAELTFDVQWADSLLANRDPAVIVGLRLRLNF